MGTRIVLVAAALALFAPPATAQESAFTNRATQIRATAGADAPVVASLPENAPVEVLSRAGGWTQVRAEGKTGWLRVFHLRFPARVESAPASGGGFGGLTAALGFGRPAAQDAKVANVGIRGLTQEDLKNANPSPEAVKKMQSFRSDRPGAERFAREAKLAAVAVVYVDEGGNPLPLGGAK